ncbi:glycosyl hydrolase family 17 protein [Pontiella sp.]|uniref:glycosyl hydrolase family 17 protein n=1 Tax=Pontiella sp. TaxID=2837462 RepID=UPI003569B73B
MFLKNFRLIPAVCLIGLHSSCSTPEAVIPLSGRELLGNHNVPAISYSGHRKIPRSVENTPSIAETKEDLKILSAMGIRMLRTYDAGEFPHAERTLKGIRELKKADPDFEMYVMLGAWIQCRNAYRQGTDHSLEDADWNQREIEAAIRLAAEYPDIVKVIAVGNEAMVTWQAHFVPAATILKYVNILREARTDGRIPAQTLITSSDNWAALGGEAHYRNDALAELMRKMDFVSLHTYAFHDTFYNPALQWAPLPDEADLPVAEQIAKSVERSIALQKAQYNAVAEYLKELGFEKEIHIGETGWASLDNAQYGPEGTCAADEYTAKVFYDACRKWTRENNLTCFYFEAFDEPWKSKGTDGSEGHFGLFTVDGQAKYALWDLVDAGAFEGLSRGGHPVTKTHGGNKAVLLEKLKTPKHRKH